MKADRVQHRLEKHRSPWRQTADGDAITRTYTFPSFRAAIAFVAYVAELAEAADHHPDIDVRYSKVTLTLSTHSSALGCCEMRVEQVEANLVGPHPAEVGAASGVVEFGR